MRRCTSKLAGLLLLVLSSSLPVYCQQPVKCLGPEIFSRAEFARMKMEIGRRKNIPPEFERQILLALSYFPELTDVTIDFRVRKSRTPLSSRPSWGSVLLPHRNRNYVITISDSTRRLLSPILFKNLDFNAQVGVIGHELSHIIDFSSKGGVGLIGIGIGNISRRFLDRFEYRTDSICIAHGLGYQLLAWSLFVRKALKRENWNGAGNIHAPMRRERYMNPETIRRQIGSNPVYRK